MLNERQLNQDLLSQAIKTNDLELFSFILQKDQSLAHDKINKFYYPLHLACEYNRQEIVKHLILNERVNVNSICSLTGFTPLMYACQVSGVYGGTTKDGNMELIQWLVESEESGGGEADIFVNSYLTGRDALQICIDANFDKLSEYLSVQKKKKLAQ